MDIYNKNMRLIILGPPGSGKGTQAKILSEELRLKHLSSGDLLRKEVSKKTVLGNKIKKYLDKGNLIPDKLMDGFIKRILPKDNFLIDGYPRRLKEAEFLDSISNIDKIIFLDVPFHTIKSRLLKRAKIEGRSDDTPETIKHRFKVYREETQPLLKYYKNKIVLVDGDRTPEDIEKDIIKLLKNGHRNIKVKS